MSWDENERVMNWVLMVIVKSGREDINDMKSDVQAYGALTWVFKSCRKEFSAWRAMKFVQEPRSQYVVVVGARFSAFRAVLRVSCVIMGSNRIGELRLWYESMLKVLIAGATTSAISCHVSLRPKHERWLSQGWPLPCLSSSSIFLSLYPRDCSQTAVVGDPVEVIGLLLFLWS